ncbi:GNAT family N-acetyltransferase [Chitinophaga sp. SYP-B3965]|uniref:GNAT family N-acetyltransferase n=1 Tax=Chitinophaga sp. SYP-B3965 TaxID=2663120 RepID=UPI0012995AA3|nr:GNAT family N-acetyltransferase [Chitinophaga sp. SYP-B3965]MRG47726.1 GNAT family N-acetyltransferase [Chitinophaga sp. SYP-B3965]
MQHFLPNGKKLVIRRPEVSDAQACLDCFLQLTQETDFLLYTHEEAKKFDLAAEEAFIRSYLHHPDNLFLIAEADGEVVGTLSLNQARFQKQKHMALMGVAVLHRYWNMGIGRRLLTAAIRWVEEHPHITTIHFEVLATNERAIQLYRNFNFIEHGRIPQGLRQTNGDWIDLVVMSKRIKH